MPIYTDGDRARLALGVVTTLMRHEAHGRNVLHIAFIAGCVATSLLSGRGALEGTRSRQLRAIVEESLIERERLAARALLAIMLNEASIGSRLAQLEAA